jgi:hypothetical protein
MAARGSRTVCGADQAGNLEQAQDHLHDAIQAHEQKHEASQTLAAAIGADVRIFDEVADTETGSGQAEVGLRELLERATLARQARAAANTKVEVARAALHVATAEAQRDALGLRPSAHPDLLSLLRHSTELRWPTTADASDGTQMDDEILALHEAILMARRRGHIPSRSPFHFEILSQLFGW